MKKIILLFVFIFACAENIEALNVSSATYFKELYKSGGTQDILLENGIAFNNSPLGVNGTALDMTVNMAGFELLFENNSNADGNGGAISLSASTITFIGGIVTFANNAANDKGGAVFNYGGYLVFTSSVVNFTNNGAGKYGGAIYNDGQLIFDILDGTNIVFTGNTAAFGNDIYQEAQGTITISGTGNITFDGGIEGSGLINKTDNGNVYFGAGSKTDFSGTFNIDGGGVYFGTSAVIGKLNIGNAALGLNIDFAGLNSSRIYTSSIDISAAAKLSISALSAPDKVVGSSTAIIFAESKSGAGFSTNNILGGDANGYRFLWSGFEGEYTGWLVYGALPWNAYRSQVVAAANWDTICLAQDIKAQSGDDTAFGMLAGKNFNLAGFDDRVYIIDSSGLLNKGPRLAYSSSAEIRNLTFKNFVRSGFVSGGALTAIYGSTITFTDTLNFIGNTAMSGGAVNGGESSNNNATSYLNFIFSTVTFISNSAVGNSNMGGSGGAVLNTESFLNFTRSNIIFTNNMASVSGGAIGILNTVYGEVNVTASYLNFSANSASFYGGAIYNNNRTSFNIVSSTVKFIDNSVGTFGGAIYNTYGSFNVIFSTADFIDNKASDEQSFGGVAANVNGSSLNFASSTVNFTGNGANRFGGALYNVGGSSLNFTASIVNFTNNGAGLYGGALYNSAASINFTSSSVNFTGNSAQYGGAIYNAGRLVFDTLLGNNIAFEGNTAAFGNDIYQEAIGTTTISGNGNVIINGGIAGAGLITKDGSATFYINANSGGYLGTFEQNAGKTIVSSGSFGGLHNINNSSELEFATGSSFTSGSSYTLNNASMTISANNDLTFSGQLNGNGVINKTGNGKIIFEGDISFIEGTFNAVNGEIVFANQSSYTGKTLNINGATLNMQNESAQEIRADNFIGKTNIKLDIFNNGDNDKIIAAYADIGGSIDIRAGVGTYKGVPYELITASGGVNGEFVNADKIISNAALEYELFYTGDTVKIIVSGKAPSDFTGLGGLSYNQEQTAKIFDEISTTSTGEWNKILSEMNGRQVSGGEKEISQVKSFLTQTSGYFLANVIRNAASGSPNNEIYDKIRNHSDENKTNGGLWAQFKWGIETFKEDDKSTGDYQDESLGLMFGYDLTAQTFDSGLVYGIYARINKENVNQGQNRADGNKNGLGIYGGYIRDNWEMKAMLLGSYDKFSAERLIMEEKAKADINAFTVNADIEGALNIWLGDILILKSYAGLEIERASYGNFQENGAGKYNLDIEKGSYLRSAARIGAGVDYEQQQWIWYAKAEGKYLLSGSQPEIRGKFEDMQISFNSRGSQEGKIALGLGAGGEIKAGKNFILYANINYYGAQRYSNIYGNMGIRYIFGE